MKKIISLLIMIMTVCLVSVLLVSGASVPASALSEGDFVYVVSNGNATVSGYLGHGGTVKIPSTLGGYPVTAIGGGLSSSGGAFRNNRTMTSITLPDSVTTIGKYAFAGCTSLMYVDFSDGLTTIGDYAFNGCTLLDSVDLGDSVTTIGESAFSNCTKLSSIGIGTGVTTIGNAAFYNCSDLKDVYIKDVKSWCNINFGGGISSPMHYADNLYLNRELINNLVIPDEVTTVPAYAFYCDNITSVEMGSGVTNIGIGAFSECYNLTSVYITDIASWCGITFGSYDSNPLRYGAKLYIKGSQTPITELNIPDGVEMIGDYAFDSYEHLTSVVIPDSVKTVGNRAFYNCFALTSVELGNKVESIGGYSFYSCAELTSVTIPDSVTMIGAYAFRNCSALESVEIGCGVTTIWDRAFYYCSSLEKLTVKGNPQIYSQAFFGCYSLTSLEFGDGATAVSNEFGGLTTVKTLTFTKNLVDMKNELFINCPLETVYFRGTRDEWDSMVYAQDKQFENVNIIIVCYEHTYDNDGDAVCNECGFERVVYTPGDLDGVEGVTDSDAVFLLFHTYFPEDYPIDQPVDYDGDGSITDSDAVYLLFHTYFPEDYPLYATTPAMTVMENASTKKDEE